jgi:HTH-type transcriptional regulator/antitoxin HigA
MYQSKIEEFKNFISPISALVNIKSEDDYQKALLFLDELFEVSRDEINCPISPLIDMVGASIERYESLDSELMDFIHQAEKIPLHIAVLNFVMKKHNITGADIPEIGDKTAVSRVLSGQRPLTKLAIEKLCIRFNLRPDLLLNLELKSL